MAVRTRCPWAESSPVMQAYHDEEWGVPERDSRALWEKLQLDGFQAGLSWSIILNKRDAFRELFAGFDPEAVARFGAEAPNVVAAASCSRPGDPVADGIDVIRAEFEYAVSHEGALTVDDIVDRRTRIGLVAADRARVTAVAGEFLSH